jgi:hypothetical protein
MIDPFMGTELIRIYEKNEESHVGKAKSDFEEFMVAADHDYINFVTELRRSEMPD